MHHVVVERWSRGSSALHSRDARAKLLALAAFLLVVATTPANAHISFAAYAVVLLAGIFIAKLPAAGVLARAALILPFSGAFAALSWLAGDTTRAIALLERSYLSALAVLITASTTPLERMAAAMESLGVPRFLVLVIQFLYRYLFVISEQAQHMRLAAACRGGWRGRVGFRSAAGALAVLFARSYERAESVYRSMLARGFSGRYGSAGAGRFGAMDALFLVAVVLAAAVARLAP